MNRESDAATTHLSMQGPLITDGRNSKEILILAMDIM